MKDGSKPGREFAQNDSLDGGSQQASELASERVADKQTGVFVFHLCTYAPVLDHWLFLVVVAAAAAFTDV